MTVLRYLRKIIPVLVSIVLILAVQIEAFAKSDDGIYIYYNDETQYSALIMDEARLFVGNEGDALLESMEAVTKYANAAIVTLSNNPYGDTETYANRFLLDFYGDDVSAVVFVIDMDLRTLTVWADGAVRRNIEPKATTITDNVYRYASNEEYYKCAKEAIDEINIVIEGGRIAQPMKHLSNLCIAILSSLLITYIVARISSSTLSASDDEVLESIYSNVELTNTRKVFVGETREYSPRKSSSGGGFSSGGGGGGGGGSHGF